MKRGQGHTDLPLNEAGREQARALAATLARLPLAALYSSDLLRARETAEIILAAFPAPLPYHPDARLREVDVGLVAGLTVDEARERFPEWREKNAKDPLGTPLPGGESFRDLAERVRAAAAGIAARHPARAVGVVTHGGPIRALVLEALGWNGDGWPRLAFDNCGFTVLEWGPAPRLLALNVSRRWME